MVVGVLELVLAVPAATLKEKRGIIRRIITRTQNKFNLSIAEIDRLDAPASSVLGFSMVGNDRRFVNEVLSKTINHIDGLFLATIVDQQITIENF